MSRSLVALRPARAEDAEVLLELWAQDVRRATGDDQLDEMHRIIKRGLDSDDNALLVAELDGRIAGAVHLRLSTVSPLNLEGVVQVLGPRVFPDLHRHGVGRALMEAGVSWAEQHGIPHIGTSAASTSRDANRFMARLGLRPRVTIRRGATSMVRARLTATDPAPQAATTRQLTQVLAVRRSMRRHQAAG